MKKSLTLLLALISTLGALANGGMRFEKMTWEQVKAKAAREKKMIFFDAYTTWCGPCKYLEENVYTDAEVAAYFNANYINVKFDMEDGEGIQLAEEFDITSYPTLLFFSSDGKLVHKFIGAMKAPEFVQLGKDASDPQKQYYTLKSRVENRVANNGDFVKWTEMAEELEDEDRGAVASSWLAGQKDVMADPELLRVMMLYSDVSDEQLHFLYQNQEKIATILGWDKDKVATTLYRKLFNLALKKAEDKTRGNGLDFGAIVAQFDAGKKHYAEIDLAMLKAFYEDDDANKAASILINSIRGEDRLSIREFTALLIDYSPRFETDQVNTILEALASHTFSAADLGEKCWFHIAEVICFSKSGEIGKAKVAAQKAVAEPNIPAHYKQVLTESFEL